MGGVTLILVALLVLLYFINGGRRWEVGHVPEV